MADLTATGQAAERARMGIAGLHGAGEGHFVATYGELGLRLHAGDIAPADLETVVIDEACDLDGGHGGDASAELDMLLARLRAEKKASPRIVAFTSQPNFDLYGGGLGSRISSILTLMEITTARDIRGT